jgi:hypothetical protein
MAIVVEEERSKVNIIQLLGWFTVLGVVGASLYYLFFAAPDLVVIPPPPSFTAVAPLSSISVSPESVLNSPAYTALKAPPFPLPTPQGPAQVGRVNPFVAP